MMVTIASRGIYPILEKLLGITVIGVSLAWGALDDGANGPGIPEIGTQFYINNHLGSPSVITNEAGEEVTRLEYAPYGELLQDNLAGDPISTGTDNFREKFTGKEWDDEAGLYYYGARYYSPVTGRFISADDQIGMEDPEHAAAWNPYAYCGNQPVTNIDSDGRMGRSIGPIRRFRLTKSTGPRYPALSIRIAGKLSAGETRRFLDKVSRRVGQMPHGGISNLHRIVGAEEMFEILAEKVASDMKTLRAARKTREANNPSLGSQTGVEIHKFWRDPEDVAPNGKTYRFIAYHKRYLKQSQEANVSASSDGLQTGSLGESTDLGSWNWKGKTMKEFYGTFLPEHGSDRLNNMIARLRIQSRFLRRHYARPKARTLSTRSPYLLKLKNDKDARNEFVRLLNRYMYMRE